LAEHEGEEKSGEGEGEGGDYDDTKSIVESARSENHIHSQKSMEALVSKSKAKMSMGMGGGGGLDSVREEEGGFEKALEEPRIITHTEDNGSRLEEKKNLSKLPYLNRNPAI